MWENMDKGENEDFSDIESTNATINSSVDDLSTNIDSPNSRSSTLILNISTDSSEDHNVINIRDSDDGSLPPLEHCVDRMYSVDGNTSSVPHRCYPHKCKGCKILVR